MTPRATPKKKPKRPNRPRIDWTSALRYYLELPPGERRFASVAEKFGCSDVGVGKHARAHGWEAAAAEVDRKARLAAERAAGRTAQERASQTSRIRDLAAGVLERRLTPADPEALPDLDARVVVRIFTNADKMTRLDEGTATDRVEVSEIQRTLADFVIRIGRFVAPEHREAFLGAVQAFESERREDEQAVVA